MSGLLPTSPDTSTLEDTEPRVIGVDSDEADDLLGALSSRTAREILVALHEEPASASAVAARVDTSLQNAQYHIGKLENAALVDVIDTVYSAKGREMKVYGPADRPLVVFAGQDDERGTIKSALASLVGGLGVVAVLSVIVQYLIAGQGSLFGFGAKTGGGDGAVVEGDVELAAEATRATVEAAGSAGFTVPPGLWFFLGGVTVLLVVSAVWYYRTR